MAAISNASRGSLVGEWPVGERKVCLFRESAGFAFSIEGVEGSRTAFTPAPYDISFARNLVRMFQRTIGMNLQNDEANPFCFVPRLCMDAGENPPVRVALFGRVVTTDGGGEQLKGLRWGVFHLSTSEEETFEVSDPVTRECVRQVNSAQNAQGFSVVFARDPTTTRITAVALKYQRSWYERGGKTCESALLEYLSSPDTSEIPKDLKYLGLAPDQISLHHTEVDVACFRSLMQLLVQKSDDEQQQVYQRLKIEYPAIYAILIAANNNPEADGSVEELSLIRETLRKGVAGQDIATDELEAALFAQRPETGRGRALGGRQKPPVYVLAGPSGVGKTQLAKEAARCKVRQFGNSRGVSREGDIDRLVRIDMGDYLGEHDSTKLFGSSSGYVGSTDLSHFAKSLERYASPERQVGKDGHYERTVTNAIILFDEIEKAHPRVKDSLLKLFDEGSFVVNYTPDVREESGYGINRTVTYILERCIILGTSNLYADRILEDFRNNATHEEMKTHFRDWNVRYPIPGKSFTPEFQNRFTLLPFGPVPKGPVFRDLIRAKLPEFCADLKKGFGCISVQVSPEEVVLPLLEGNLYGDGTGLRRVEEYFLKTIRAAVTKQIPIWNGLKDKRIIITSVNNNSELGIKCVRMNLAEATECGTVLI
jgi:hypothetical protein